MERLRKSFWFKTVAVYTAFSLLAQIFYPTAAFALTGGPSQPEVESFEPVGTTDMVEMFSGDFNYNIPLLTVPGPNGGYPINLAYHAGVGLDQEASWVGLGWNINPGEINRNLRGLPDDFNGDNVTKKLSHKPNITAGLSYTFKKSVDERERWGFDGKLDPLTGQPTTYYVWGGGMFNPSNSTNYRIHLYYNNYKGLGFATGYSHDKSKSGVMNSNSFLKTIGIDANFDSQTGFGLQPSASYTKTIGDKVRGFTIAPSYNSREGKMSLSFSAERHWTNKGFWGKMARNNIGSGRPGSGISFNSSGYVPNASPSLLGIDAKFNFEKTDYAMVSTTAAPGQANINQFGKGLLRRLSNSFEFNFSYEGVKDKSADYKAYGYLHSENRTEDKTLLDFNREKEAPVSKQAPHLPIPIHTYDSYIIKGQGIGGVFRPYRSDVGVLSDPINENDFGAGTFGLENMFPVSGNKHVGIDASGSWSHSYSGKWRADATDVESACAFQSAGPEGEAPFYFKTAGDLTADSIDESNRFGGENLEAFRIKMHFGVRSFVPKVDNVKESNNNTYVAYSNRTTRSKRVQSIQYRTNYEIYNNSWWLSAAPKPKFIYNENEIPANDGSNGSAITYPTAVGGHIGEISVLNPDGNKYVYGLPVYNSTQTEACFAVDNSEVGGSGKSVAYDETTEPTTSNKSGEDWFYGATTLPKYAHSYMLTAIYSPDYVDLTNDGPTSDDLGYYVKFNYTTITPAGGSQYKWRVPYTDGSYMSGYYSNIKDDKSSYTYGEKEIYYLNSVETKTHIAVFEINNDSSDPRLDSKGAYAEQNMSSGTYQGMRLRKLNTIKLYSKLDLPGGSGPGIPIKTVSFEYDYHLCKNAVNNSNYPSGTFMSSGKLTLSKVKFSYLNDTKGTLSPYVFTYNQYTKTNGTQAICNPNYRLNAMDRWGYYKPDKDSSGGYNFYVEDNPYVDQVESTAATDERTAFASAWNLSTIQLPSGGTINVQYESDDYAYVQDQKAMELMQITGMADENGNYFSNSSKDLMKASGNERNRVYFKTGLASPTTQNVKDMFNGIDRLYFKAWMKLKKKFDNTDIAYDYVDGYCQIDRDNYPTTFCGTGSSGTAWVKVKFVPRRKTDGSAEAVHPFRKACWEYLKLHRPDLLYPSLADNQAHQGANVASYLLSILRQLESIIGFYEMCAVNQWGSEVLADEGSGDFRPSFLRINSVKQLTAAGGETIFKKYGGGHRVKKIVMNNDWSAMNSSSEGDDTYGQEYQYTLADGSSSGVAEYEPLVGGEEIPQHLPTDRFKSDQKFITNDKDLYQELPYGESYMPAAGVGYSRVIVKNLVRKNGSGTEVNKRTQSGISVYEFYTAKDFPVFITNTEVQHKGYPPVISIPFIGALSFANHGYSQGCKIELNDMHGKPKAETTYAYNQDLNSSLTVPVTKTSYIYNTTSTYNPDGSNRLNNLVTVLDRDADIRSAFMGENTDMTVDMNENFNTNLEVGVQTNFEYDPTIPYVVPMLIPIFNYSESMFRSVMNVKVITRTGILSETRNTRGGSTAITKNLMFDAYTGQSLLSSVTNDFDKPVYTYQFAAHWAYPNIGSAYQNERLNLGFPTFSTIATSSGVITLSGGYAAFAKYFTVGDHLEITDLTDSPARHDCWVSAISGTSITLIDDAGSLASFPSITNILIVESGHQNQQSVPNGVIVSLSNPVTDRQFPMFAALDTALYANTIHEAAPSFDYIDCYSGETRTVTISFVGDHLIFSQTGLEEGCSAYVDLSNGPTITFGTINDFRFYKKGNKILIINMSTSPHTHYIADWNDANHCYLECLQDVLHADATRFNNDWTFDYADIGNPQVKTSPSSSLTNLTNTLNPYKFKNKTVWRKLNSWLYQVDRKQGSPQTDISTDGTYKNFVLYDWNISETNNPLWTKTSEVRRYSPYGYETENKDALDVYSSAIYGYNNSVPTGVAANNSYYETAFDGFEDYTAHYDLSPQHGHLHFTAVNPSFQPVVEPIAHTGDSSLALSSGYGAYYSIAVPTTSTYHDVSTTFTGFAPLALETYNLSLWVKNPAHIYDGYATVNVYDGSTVIGTQSLSRADIIVEGWHKVDIKFTAPAVGNTFKIQLNATDAADTQEYFDDIRLEKFKGGLTTYVYDPVKLWLRAELDNRNFATFYNYDDEGTLIQVKKETEKGIMTIKTTRNNIRQ